MDPVRPEQLGLDDGVVVEADLGLGPGHRAFGVGDVGLREDQALGRDDDPGRTDERNDGRHGRPGRGPDPLLERQQLTGLRSLARPGSPRPPVDRRPVPLEHSVRSRAGAARPPLR